jgi:hypothetical protein
MGMQPVAAPAPCRAAPLPHRVLVPPRACARWNPHPDLVFNPFTQTGHTDADCEELDSILGELVVRMGADMSPDKTRARRIAVTDHQVAGVVILPLRVLPPVPLSRICSRRNCGAQADPVNSPSQCPPPGVGEHDDEASSPAAPCGSRSKSASPVRMPTPAGPESETKRRQTKLSTPNLEPRVEAPICAKWRVVVSPIVSEESKERGLPATTPLLPSPWQRGPCIPPPLADLSLSQWLSVPQWLSVSDEVGCCNPHKCGEVREVREWHF